MAAQLAPLPEGKAKGQEGTPETSQPQIRTAAGRSG